MDLNKYKIEIKIENKILKNWKYSSGQKKRYS